MCRGAGRLCRTAHFCTVPALEAKLGCLGFLVRSTLRTLSVISSTWAWTLFRQMSDRGLQYWSIKTAPAKNKLHKKQDFSFFLCLVLPALHSRHAASGCSRTAELCVWNLQPSPGFVTQNAETELTWGISGWTQYCPLHPAERYLYLEQECCWIRLDQLCAHTAALAPPQCTEIFTQSLKQCQLHSNCLSSDFPVTSSTSPLFSISLSDTFIFLFPTCYPSS